MKQHKKGPELKDRNWPVHFLVVVCCLFALWQPRGAYGSAVRLAYGSAAGHRALIERARSSGDSPDSQFAIGDFDGDRQPDLATVELIRFNPLHSRYSISFQLSRGRLERVALTGPGDGLLLLARDVNGDRALDLVLVTSGRHELLAVLLNDGSGNFAAADPAQFRINFVWSRAKVATALKRMGDRTVLATPDPLAGDLESDPSARPAQESGLAQPSCGFAGGCSQSSFLGRAPPRFGYHA